MREIYSVGPDELSGYEGGELPAEFEWVVYWYEASSYDGTGVLVVKIGPDSFGITGLGHCSCYGPLSDCEWSIPYLTQAGLLKELEFEGPQPRTAADYDFIQWQLVARKVCELLQIDSPL